MPHLVLKGDLDYSDVAERMESCLHRSGRSVLKTEGCWLKHGGKGLLVEGVVVEFSRPLHPVAVVMPRQQDTIVRLWSLVTVERTPAVQRWLVLVAHELQRCGGGNVISTNISEEISSEMGLSFQA